MALLINSDGSQRGIDLHLDAAIKSCVNPALCTELQISNRLGLELCDDYECNRLEDGRILFSFWLMSGASVQVLLTHEESLLVETMKENSTHSIRQADDDAALIERMTFQDVVLVDGGYSTARTIDRVFCTDLVGVRLLIALLLAKKMKPTDVLRRSGLSSSVFLAEVARMRLAGVFSDWE